jgi:ABC-type sugar transport system permease subunit
MVQGIRLSFSQWGGTGAYKWIGFANYRSIFANGFSSTLWLTVRYSAISTVGIVLVATLMAAVVSAGVPGARVYRIIWFLPGIAPLVAVSVFWSVAFQPTGGVVDTILGYLGLGSTHAWLATSSQAIYPIAFVTIWAGAGFAFLVVLGGMEQIPVALYEAARLDGANWPQIFFRVMLPMVRPVLGVIGLLEAIWSFNGFTIIWGMTEGGPGYSTSTVPVLVYDYAFHETQFGPAGAMAVVGGLILVALGFVMLRLSRSTHTERA